jgi:trimethylamine--corrinoid protein Co-methyltransferase
LKERFDIKYLSSEIQDLIASTSLDVLQKTGVIVKNTEASALLMNAGCSIDSGRILYPSDLVKQCMSTVPTTFNLFSRDGERLIQIGQQETIFNPGSAAVFFKDHENTHIRKATIQDMESIVKLVEHLEFMSAQSTAVIPSDVPPPISDLYRLYVILGLSRKPIITGAFSSAGFHAMRKMLEVVSGGSDGLADEPRAVFDCCPTSPLLWSDTTCQNLIDCAKYRIPAQIVPAPIAGATSPVSLFGTLVQSNAEVLSGIVISQLTNPGTPVVYGCASSTLDMKHGVPRYGSVESILLACASAELGRHYGFPTHAYLGTSDSKTEDSQSGFESGIGLALAALTGINVVSGPGMSAQLNCQSLEKLVLDNEICGLSYRLKRGIDLDDKDLIAELIGEVAPKGNYLKSRHTLQKHRSELMMPSEVVCRLALEAWNNAGMKDSSMRAKERVDEILRHPVSHPLPSVQSRELDNILKDALSSSP